MAARSGFCASTQLADDRVAGLDPFPHVLLPHCLQDPEIRPGREVLLERAGEDDDADARIAQKGVQCRWNLAEHLPVDRVERRASILNPGNALFHAQSQELVRHGRPSFIARWPADPTFEALDPSGVPRPAGAFVWMVL